MNRRPDGADDDQRLRDLLHDAVSDVEPRHGLDAIQARTKVTPMSARPWIFGVGGAVVATAATIVAFTVVNDDSRQTSGPLPADQPSTVAESPTVTDEGTPSEEPSKSAATDDMVAVPVYYLGDTPQGPRLYREFHQSTADLPDDRLVAALSDAVHGEPLDPDYHSPWPAGIEVVEGAFDGSAEGSPIMIGLRAEGGTDLSERPEGMSEQTAEMAVQQLVYTVTAATQSTPGVQFLINGEPTDKLLGVPVTETVKRADPLSTQALVWIIDPAEGTTVEGAFEVNGVGAFHEANVLWQLRDGDTVVKQGHAMSLEAFRIAPYSFHVSAPPPGTYTLVVAQSDPSGGKEGSGPAQDTKTITVR
jgi:hypothetical protein